MATVPPFTQVPGGFVTAQPLDDKFVIEGWWLTREPHDFDKPCTEPVYHLIADNEDEAQRLVTKFVADLTKLIPKL